MMTLDLTEEIALRAVFEATQTPEDVKTVHRVWLRMKQRQDVRASLDAQSRKRQETSR